MFSDYLIFFSHPIQTSLTQEISFNWVISPMPHCRPVKLAIPPRPNRGQVFYSTEVGLPFGPFGNPWQLEILFGGL